MIVLLCLLTIPRTDVATQTVDVIELNHFYDGNGRHVFDQVILWDWCEWTARHEVRDWRMFKPDMLCGPRTLLWNDGETIRHVKGHSWRETWTQHDPELREREFLPKCERRGLLP